MKLWIVNEENHSSLIVTKDIYLGIKWLIENDWILPVSEYLLEDETVLPMWRFIGFTQRASCTKQDIYLFFANKTQNEVLEILENLGFYFSRINYVES